MTEEWKETQHGNVIKFEKEGDALEGVFISIEPSRKYPDSYALKVKEGEEVKVVFVNNIVFDQIETNNIKRGQEIKVEYLGKKKSEVSGREYHSYKVFFK